MITGPINHGLHVLLSHKLNLQPTQDLFTLSFNPHRLRYELFFTPLHHRYNLISLIPTWQQSTLALSRIEVLRVADYLQTNAFPDLVVVGQEECPCPLQKKATRGAMSKVVRETAGQTWPGLTLEISTSASTIYHTTQ